MARSQRPRRLNFALHVALLPLAITALLAYVGSVLWSIRISLSSSKLFPRNDWVVHAFQAAWSAIVTTPVPQLDPSTDSFPAQHLRLALENVVRAGNDTVGARRDARVRQAEDAREGHGLGVGEVLALEVDLPGGQLEADTGKPWIVDVDPQLGADFGLRIPVLARADGQSLDWPFDAEQARVFLLSPAG